ncbi:MAG TPA: mycofactocin-associated electron transfer flavoprotein alpha subunit [Acidimicrobiales bacterium]
MPAGGAEVVDECDGVVVLVGDGSVAAAAELAGHTDHAQAWDTPGFSPGAWARALAPLLVEHTVVVLPASADGRDLAPRLAYELRRPLLAGAVRVRPDGAELARRGGMVLEDVVAEGPFVATLQPGVRGAGHVHGPLPHVEALTLTAAAEHAAEVVELLPPDVTTMDLAEAPRIVGGGAGLDGAERFAQLHRVATAINAATGATRVVTDRGWASHQRQIGTTGVVVDPRLYIAFGISGAVQHTSGLGQPDHIISVNTDANCPMMQMADLAILSDANGVLDALEALLHPAP